METDAGPKRQSLYTPPKGREPKRSKSEDSMHQRSLDDELVAERSSLQIGDVLSDLKDLCDDFNQQQAQVRFLIWQCAEHQRQEASTKISIKNWWKYDVKRNRDYYTLENHRQAVVEHYAKEAGIADGKMKSFQYSNYIGRNLSPFCVVDVGDARTRQAFLEHMKMQYTNKTKEWVDPTMRAEIDNRSSDHYSKSGVNGVLVFEPMIATFDKIQSVPLKLIMGVISELKPDLTWKKDWAQNTVFIPDAQGGVDTYVAWRALDHLHGRGIVYINEELFERRVFRETLVRHELSWLSGKGFGKGKGKAVSTVGILTQDEAMNPEGSFMEQIGHARRSDGKGKRNGYNTSAEKALKAELPFRLEVQGLPASEFVKTYNQHVYRLLTRWSS